MGGRSEFSEPKWVEADSKVQKLIDTDKSINHNNNQGGSDNTYKSMWEKQFDRKFDAWEGVWYKEQTQLVAGLITNYEIVVALTPKPYNEKQLLKFSVNRVFTPLGLDEDGHSKPDEVLEQPSFAAYRPTQHETAWLKELSG